MQRNTWSMEKPKASDLKQMVRKNNPVRVKPVKSWKGNVPRDGVLVARFGEWMLFYRNGVERYKNLKLVFDGRRNHKANFWLAYDVERQCWIGNHSTKVLAVQAEYAELNAAVLAWLQANRDRWGIWAVKT